MERIIGRRLSREGAAIATRPWLNASARESVTDPQAFGAREGRMLTDMYSFTALKPNKIGPSRKGLDKSPRFV